MTKEEIKATRKALHMTQTQFAVALGFSERHITISAYETGRAVPNKRVLELIKHLAAKIKP